MGGEVDADFDREPLTIPAPGFGDWVALARFTQPYRLVEAKSTQPVASGGVIAQQPRTTRVTRRGTHV
ncbi:hypothetical protein [Kibdelosporangium phytohabitans]|uniref:Uncharacterized protein n=1 Tax=Kibdelosporangium phytohabitans TaxID=860235 RepID=A0A0N9I893_9PSEU|nr:hypothetical protein [Kibdelosporangium phytohabitans]ALG12521.1 hypothetical protein AOZ06_41715 [Kibdelosporangium phytohabitans]MBE1464124.1 hypothetical protein [Kibdelosporangium phytohabitans]